MVKGFSGLFPKEKVRSWRDGVTPSSHMGSDSAGETRRSGVGPGGPGQMNQKVWRCADGAWDGGWSHPVKQLGGV